MKGRLQVITAEENNEVLAKARLHQWTQISPASQASFATSLIPGEEISHESDTEGLADGGDSADSEKGAADEGAAKGGRPTRRRGGSSGSDRDAAEEEENQSKTPVSDDFCLVLLWPNFVDHLRLGDGQTRNLHKIQGDRDGGGELLAARAPASLEAPGAAETGVEEEGGGAAPPVTWVTMAVNP